MRRTGLSLLCLLALLGAGAGGAVEARGADDAGPSLEYRPPRPVLPEPKAPTPAPPVTLFREIIGGFGIGTGSFDQPVDVAVHPPNGNLYVLDAGNNRVQVFDRSANFLVTFGSRGTRDGEFIDPRAIALDQGEFIYVVDTGNDRIQKFGWVDGKESCGTDLTCPRTCRPDGFCLKFVVTWGTQGSRNGDFKRPVDITIDSDGNSFVLDAGNERIQKFDPTGRFVSDFGRFTRSLGGDFTNLVSLAWSDERFGSLYLLGPGCVVQQFQHDGVLVKTWPATAPESGLCVPARMEIDNEHDYVYVLDSGNGLLTRFSLEGWYLAALRGAERPFEKPRGFAMSTAREEIVVADTGNDTVQKFTLR